MTKPTTQQTASRRIRDHEALLADATMKGKRAADLAALSHAIHALRLAKHCLGAVTLDTRIIQEQIDAAERDAGVAYDATATLLRGMK